MIFSLPSLAASFVKVAKTFSIHSGVQIETRLLGGGEIHLFLSDLKMRRFKEK